MVLVGPLTDVFVYIFVNVNTTKHESSVAITKLLTYFTADL